MQKNIKFLTTLIKNFLSFKDLGIYVDKNLEIKTYSSINGEKFLRFYVAISHAHLRFEIIKVPTTITGKKRLSASRLEAIRIFNLLGENPEKFLFSYFFCGEEVWIAAVEKEKLIQITDSLSRGLVCGVFPAWVSLWAHLKKRAVPPSQGLFYVKHENGYEGFWLENGLPKGILPYSPKAAEKFISLFKGPVEQLSGNPHQILAQGAALVPTVFSPQEVPTFEQYPLLLKPQISPKVFLFWLFPLLIWSGGLIVNEYYQQTETRLKIVEKELEVVQKKYRILEESLKKAKLQEELKKAIRPYLPGQRTPLLKVLLEFTLSFPQEAWVRRLEFRTPDQIRIWGEAKNALNLLEILSKNPLFKEVKFLSTVTKNPITGRENFSIQVTLSLDKLS